MHTSTSDSLLHLCRSSSAQCNCMQAPQRACCCSLAEACAVTGARRRLAASNNKRQWSKRCNRQKTWNRAHCCSPSATWVLKHAAPPLLALAGCQAEAYGVTQCQEDCCKPVSIQWY